MEEVDVSSFNQNEGNASRVDIRKQEGQANGYRSFQENDHYDMSKEKILIIFNHEKFNNSAAFGPEKPMTRYGTKFDVEVLDETFKSLGFVVQIYQDLPRKKIIKAVEKLVNQDHSNTSCVAIAILTHGLSNGYLFAKNKPYHLDEITKPLQHQKLMCIPKILFLQACRGNMLDKGHQVEVDGIPRNLEHVPTHIDFLILRSTVEGYVSFRDREKGSWMIQNLCAVIKESPSTLDILQMITVVNMRVARNTTYNLVPLLNEKKQCLETTFSLTKFLKLKKPTDCVQGHLTSSTGIFTSY